MLNHRPHLGHGAARSWPSIGVAVIAMTFLGACSTQDQDPASTASPANSPTTTAQPDASSSSTPSSSSGPSRDAAQSPTDGSESPASDGSDPSQSTPDDQSTLAAADIKSAQQYCDAVEQLLQDYRTQISNPSPGGAAELLQRSKTLTSKGQDLADQSGSSQESADAVQKCLRQLAGLDNPGS